MEPDILTAVIASTSALSGVIISQAISLFQTFLNRKHEKQKLLRQKYEEMMFHFSTSLEWIRDLNGSTSRPQILAMSQCPEARKALSLCLLYFPDLADSANKYILAQLTYYAFIASSFRDGLNVTAGGQAIEQNKEQFDLLIASLSEQKNKFENLIVSNSKRFTRS